MKDCNIRFVIQTWATIVGYSGTSTTTPTAVSLLQSFIDSSQSVLCTLRVSVEGEDDSHSHQNSVDSDVSTRQHPANPSSLIHGGREKSLSLFFKKKSFPSIESLHTHLRHFPLFLFLFHPAYAPNSNAGVISRLALLVASRATGRDSAANKLLDSIASAPAALAHPEGSAVFASLLRSIRVAASAPSISNPQGLWHAWQLTGDDATLRFAFA